MILERQLGFGRIEAFRQLQQDFAKLFACFALDAEQQQQQQHREHNSKFVSRETYGFRARPGECEAAATGWPRRGRARSPTHIGYRSASLAGAAQPSMRLAGWQASWPASQPASRLASNRMRVFLGCPATQRFAGSEARAGAGARDLQDLVSLGDDLRDTHLGAAPKRVAAS